MNIEHYLQHPGFGALRPYIDLDGSLSSPERIAIIALSAGVSTRELRLLPGLKHAGRRAQVLRDLMDNGRLRLRAEVLEALPARATASERELRGALRKSKKLRMALDLMLDPLALLRKDGLGMLLTELGPDLGLALQTAIRRANGAKARDRAIRRRQRVSKLAFVGRNVPPNLFRMSTRGPLPPYAPGDLVQRTVSSMTSGLPFEAATAREGEITRLFHAAALHGETLLSHWWRILEALRDAGFEGEQLWAEWRLRLESYVLRRRKPFPQDLQLAGMEARVLRARYPVPDIGYGPWVDDEIGLCAQFWSRYKLAAGDLTHDLWIRAHEFVAANTGPGSYEHRLFAAADSLGGFEASVLAEIQAGRRTRRMKAAGTRTTEYVAGMAERSAILKAAGRVRRNPRPDTTKGQQVAWARRLLTLAARQEAGQEIDGSEYLGLIRQARIDGTHGGWRSRSRTLSERALRTLHDNLKWHPVQIAPDRPFNAGEILERVGPVLDYIESVPATPVQRTEAAESVLDYLHHRAFVEVVHDNGYMERRTLIGAARMVRQEHEAEHVLRMLAGCVDDLTFQTSAAA